MRPTLFRLLFFGVATLLISGCVLSEQPLSAAKDARPDPGLVGTWQPLDAKVKGVGRVSFGQDGLGRISVQGGHDAAGKPLAESYDFFVTRTTKGSYLNLMFPRSDRKSETRAYYEFFKYTLSENRQKLRLWSVKSGIFENGVKEGRLKAKTVRLDKTDTVGTSLLQDSSDTICTSSKRDPRPKYSPMRTTTGK